MTFGPVQMLVVGFTGTEFTGEIMAELKRLKEADIVRLVDMIVVRKQEGQVETVQTSDLSVEEAEDFGALVGALIGVGMGEEEGVEAGLIAGAEAGSDGHIIDEKDVWYLADAVPEGTTAAVALLEHRWAIPLRDKILAKDGMVLADAWIHPADLIAIGAMAAEAAGAPADA
ncbi:MAG TPA: hypothetical protein VLD16_07745 [Gaiellaceae bacterium]|nr:hypothetical protein [Gaiellaceae bacterium]